MSRKKMHLKPEKPPKYIAPIPNYIKPAGIGKRAGAFFLDLLLAGILWFACYYAVGVSFMAPKMGWYELVDQFNEVSADSSLIYYNAEDEDDENNYTQLDLEAQDNDVYVLIEGESKHYSTEEGYTYGFEIYEEVVWNYYTYFLLQDDIGFNLDETVTTYEAAAKYTLENIYGLTEENNYECIVLTIGEEDNEINYGYTLATDEDGNFDYTVRPVLMSSWDELEDGGSTQQEYAVSFLEFYYYEGSDGELFQDCISNMISDVAIYVDLNNHIDSISYLIRVPGIFVGALLTFFIIPMCTPNGRSFGKLVTGLAVISTDGFSVPKWKIAIRYGILTLFWGVFFVPTLLLALVFLLLLYVADALVLMRADRPQAIHDLPTSTIVIDIKESVWFKNEEDKQEYIRNNPDSSIALDEAEANKEPEESKPDYSADIFDYNAIIQERKYLDSKEKDEAFDDKLWETFAKQTKKDRPSSKPEDISGELSPDKVEEEPPAPQPRVGYKSKEEEEELPPEDDFADSK